MEEIGKVKISEGLLLTDSIAIPDGSLTEGMKTAPMSEKPEEEEPEISEDGENAEDFGEEIIETGDYGQEGNGEEGGAVPGGMEAGSFSQEVGIEQ